MKKKESSSKHFDLKKYQTAGDVSLGQMKFGLWLSNNRRRIIRVAVIFLIISSASLFTYSGYHYIIYFLYGRQADKDLASSLSENIFDMRAYREATAPQIILAGKVDRFNVANKQDFVVTLKNPNLNYYGVFDYCLQDNKNNDVACGHSFILPSSEKYLILAAQDIENSSGALNFQAVNVFWQRINPREISDWNAYALERLNLDIKDLKYSGPDYNARTPFHSVSFTITNNSPYHFAELPLDIILFNSANVSGVNVYNLNNLMSFETRKVQISWPSGGERANSVEIIPDVNILNPDVFLPYRG